MERVQTTRLLRADFKPIESMVIERNATLMGTSIDLLVVSDDKAGAEKAIDAALVEMSRVESVFSEWRPDSQISALNDAAGKGPITLDPEVLDLLDDALSLCTLSHGAFDITFRGAGRLYDFAARNPKPPSPEALAEAIKKINCRDLVTDRVAGTAELKRPQMAIGLGGIAKGYAVDRAVKVLRAAGLIDFVVNAGGDLYSSGRVDGRLWRVAIRHPREPGTEMAILPVSNLAVATSGDYERFFDYEGVRYHHILDPKTGQSARECQSVTILAPAAYLADALATAVFVLGPERGMTLIEELDGVEGAIVDAKGAMHRSSKLVE
ncbi:MAG: hypothetical protein AUK47_00015 [Deltaproteobacteria bacterium CG2_30_63_29]|nr:MAG: hypothetical protein AUK47_00015 [Deltaproteobacteria bacterium CG2_30_63_29]